MMLGFSRLLRRTRRFLVFVAASAGLTACGSDRTNAPNGIDVAVSFDHTPAAPGDIVIATVTAQPNDGSAIRYIRVVAHGLVARTDSIPTSGPGTQSASLQYALPFTRTGDLVLSAVAATDSKSGSAEATVTSADNSPPVFASATASLTPQLDTVRVIIAATDNAGLTGVAVRFAGSFGAVDSISASYRRSIVDTIRYAVPANADFSKQLTVSVDLYDVGVNRAHADLGQFTLSDAAPPAVRSVLLTTAGQPAALAAAAAYRPGDQLRIQLDASDNVSLALVGYRIGAPANVGDSVAVDGPTYTATRTLTVPQSWMGVSPVTFFAVDKSGHRREVTAPAMSVYPVVVRATRGLDLPGGNVVDAVFDAKRGVAYLAQPESNRILVLSTATMALGTPIATPGYPTGLDLTPSGDSLVIALRRTSSLGIVDLTAPTPVLDSVHLDLPTAFQGSHDGPYKLRVSSRNRVLVVLTIDGSGWDPLQEYDLTARHQTTRSDAAFLNGVVESDAVVAASGDRSHLVLFQGNGCCPNYATMYGSARDAFGAWQGTTDTYDPSISVDNTGEHVLIASSVFDANLSLIRVYDPPHFDLAHDRVNTTTPTVIAPAGDVAYISIGTAYYVVRLADGGVLEQVFLPTPTTRLLLVDGGATLLSIAASRVDAISLR
jgi:hypothetical protein